jgi:hypothetical protein
LRRIVFGILSLLLLGIEVLIGLYAHGWVRSYLGDVLVVILIYTVIRTIAPYKIRRWYILPAAILVFSFIVEFLQLWGFCDRLGITNQFLRIIIGTGFSWIDILCYCVGIIPCFIAEFLLARSKQ